MSQTLGGWNRSIFFGQVVLLAVVALVAYLMRTGPQAAVLVGLAGLIVLATLHAMGAMKEEREIVYDLSLGNAYGLAAALFLVFAGINYGTVPSRVTAGCFFGGMILLGVGVAMGFSAARIARGRQAPGTTRELVLSAMPVGIGPLYEWSMRRSGRTAGSS